MVRFSSATREIGGRKQRIIVNLYNRAAIVARFPAP
jgi:hypothetical protein